MAAFLLDSFEWRKDCGFVSGHDFFRKLRSGALSKQRRECSLGANPARLNSLRKDSDFNARLTKSIPQWLKPPLILLALYRG
jgi:hypothetical protein